MKLAPNATGRYKSLKKSTVALVFLLHPAWVLSIYSCHRMIQHPEDWTRSIQRRCSESTRHPSTKTLLLVNRANDNVVCCMSKSAPGILKKIAKLSNSAITGSSSKCLSESWCLLHSISSSYINVNVPTKVEELSDKVIAGLKRLGENTGNWGLMQDNIL